MTRLYPLMVPTLVLSLSACGGSEPAGPAGRGGGDPAECATSGNDAMRLRLAPTCEGCHGAGASRPFFATLAAFEDLLVYDARYVVRGDPDTSVLVALLEGRNTGTYSQMPLGSDAFSVRASRGETAVSMEEVRAWIRDLPPPEATRSGPDPEAASIRRLSAHEVINALEVALGQAPNGGVPPLIQADGVTPLAPDSPVGVDYNDGSRREAYLMLGGESYLRQRMPEPTWSPSSLVTLTQLAQAACATAVDARREVLFVHVAPTARLPDAEADVRANIEHLYRRFLQDEPSAEDIEALFSEVYAPAEATSPRDGWVQVCTALARDPLFITF